MPVVAVTNLDLLMLVLKAAWFVFLAYVIYQLKSSKSFAVLVRDRKVIRYNRGVRLICYLIWAMVVLIVSSMVINPPASGSWTAAVGLVAGFILVAVVFSAELFYQVSFTEEFIYVRSPWRRARTIRYTELRDLRYSWIFTWHVLYTDQGKVYLPDQADGVSELLVMITVGEDEPEEAVSP